MKPLNPKARAIYDAIPSDGSWIDVIALERASGLSLGDYYANVAVLKRRGLVERDEVGDYRRATDNP